MMNGEFVEMLSKAAADFAPVAIDQANRDAHMNECSGNVLASQAAVEAILVAFVNRIAMERGIDLALYTSDLARIRSRISGPTEF